MTLIRAVSVEERGEHLAGVASGKNGRREIFFFFFFETALWTAFEFSFRWKVRNGVVSVGVSPEKLVLPFW